MNQFLSNSKPKYFTKGNKMERNKYFRDNRGPSRREKLFRGTRGPFLTILPTSVTGTVNLLPDAIF